MTSCSDEGGAVDARDTLDGLGIVGYFSLDDGSLCIRIECVLYAYRYILNANGVYRRRINYLCTKVAKLHSLDIAQFVDSVCCLDNSWIGGHEAVYICPYFEYISIECCRNDSCCIV